MWFWHLHDTTECGLVPPRTDPLILYNPKIPLPEDFCKRLNTIDRAFCKILPVSGIYYREGSCPPGARASRPHRSGRSPAGPLCLRFTQRAPILRIRLGEEHPATASPAHSRRQWRWLASCLQKKGAGGTPALPGGLPPHDRFRILQKARPFILMVFTHMIYRVWPSSCLAWSARAPDPDRIETCGRGVHRHPGRPTTAAGHRNRRASSSGTGAR